MQPSVNVTDSCIAFFIPKLTKRTDEKMDFRAIIKRLEHEPKLGSVNSFAQIGLQFWHE